MVIFRNSTGYSSKRLRFLDPEKSDEENLELLETQGWVIPRNDIVYSEDELGKFITIRSMIEKPDQEPENKETDTNGDSDRIHESSGTTT